MNPQKRLQQLFREFNHQFFGNRLPAYQVKLVPPMKRSARLGDCNKRRRVIRIFLANDQQIAEILIHEMAHAASVLNHGPKFMAELRRLQQAGAPLSEAETNCLDTGLESIIPTRNQVRGDVLEALSANDSFTQKDFISWMARERDMSYAAFKKRYWWVPKVVAEAKREAREYQRQRKALRQTLLESGGKTGGTVD